MAADPALPHLEGGSELVSDSMHQHSAVIGPYFLDRHPKQGWEKDAIPASEFQPARSDVVGQQRELFGAAHTPAI